MAQMSYAKSPCTLDPYRYSNSWIKTLIKHCTRQSLPRHLMQCQRLSAGLEDQNTNCQASIWPAELKQMGSDFAKRPSSKNCCMDLDVIF